MGIDFIQRTRRTFDKHLDLQRTKLGTADLFTRGPVELCPAFSADLTGHETPKVGSELIAEADGNTLTLSNARGVVARGITVSPLIIQAVQDSCGLATAVVQEVHEFSGVVEVTLC